jgi:SlyX protein
MTQENEQRLVRLETQLAFQDDLLEQLNRQLVLQAEDIRLLQDQLHLLSQRFRELQRSNDAGEAQPSLADERPPHY